MAIIIVTGAAGFIGSHTCDRLLKKGHHIIGIDNLNAYYDPALKQHRLKNLINHPHFTFFKADIADRPAIEKIVSQYPQTDYVIHLAAQAGVRYSVTHPEAYVQSNLVGHMVILEICRNLPQLKQLIYASSSSVYGNNNQVPFRTDAVINSPRSLYAATKQSNEVLTYSYAYLYHIHATALRFFTVYGPAGRPDMAPYLFTKAIIEEKPLTLFNQGNMKRDFTYISDIVDGICAAMEFETFPNPPHRIYNLGNNQPVLLTDFIYMLEKEIGKKAIIEHQPMHPGDMIETYANIDDSIRDLKFQPSISLAQGVKEFVQWYKHYTQRISRSQLEAF